ncbi:LytTR family transcriptional regulator DNA-binding domain-containing protein [Escherichia coli]
MKVIIVEDEFLAQQELSWLIKEHSQMEIVGTFDDGLDVLKFLQHNRVDAIFLDINIPSLDGVLLAQNISQFAHKPFIVFITAWKEHAVEAFELEAFDYILKPYQESRISGMLQKLEAAWQQQQTSSTPAATVTRENDTINLVKDERIIVTPINDIYYAEAHEKMTFVYTRRESYVMPMNITEFCSKLPPSHFFRCHRSFCVNLNKIREIEPWFNNTYILRLKDLDFEVPVSRESVAQFFNITPNHLSKLFAQHGTMRFIEYVRWVRMAKARMILQKYHLSIHEVAQRCGFPDSDYFCRVFRRQFGLTPGEYSARFQG